MHRAGAVSVRAAALALGMAILVVYAAPYALRLPLVDPDEGLHASIAQGMVESGDWIVPRFLGEPFLDKPILYFWAQAASLQAFGFRETAVRLPGTLFALLGIATTMLLAWRLWAPSDAAAGEFPVRQSRAAAEPPAPVTAHPDATRLALIAGLLYATMFLPAGLAQIPVHDVALVPAVNLALVLLWKAERTGRLGVRSMLGLAVLMAWALLVKGLVGVAIIYVAYGGFRIIRAWRALATPESRGIGIALLRRAAQSLSAAIISQNTLRLATATVLGVLLAAPWYLAVERARPGFLYYYFAERHLQGLAGQGQLHGDREFWYYLPLLVAGGLPWIAYLPLALRMLRVPAEEDAKVAVGGGFTPQAWFLLSWLAGGTALLSLASVKMVTYIWPLFPPVAMLAAVAWEAAAVGQWNAKQRAIFARTLVPSAILGPIVVPGVIAAIAYYFEMSLPASAWIAAVAAGCTALAPLWCLRRGWLAVLPAAAAASTALQFFVVLAIALPAVADDATARGLAHEFNRRGALPSQVILADERIGSLVFYLDPRLRGQIDQQRLHFGKPKYALASGRGKYFTPQPGAVVYLPEKAADRAAEYFALEGLPFTRVDRYRVYEAAAMLERLKTKP